MTMLKLCSEAKNFRHNRKVQTNTAHPTSSQCNAIHIGFNGILCFLILFQVKHRTFKMKPSECNFIFRIVYCRVNTKSKSVNVWFP
jgi:hypothetical protein